MRALCLGTALVLSQAWLAPVSAMTPASVSSIALASDHPILGIWRLTLPGVSCSETYRFRGDGTTHVTSAGEVSESEFSIPAQPSAKGFYRLHDRLVKNNGKKDCAGQVMKVGVKATHYVHFHSSGTMFFMCLSESLEQCIGPFRRLTGQET